MAGEMKNQNDQKAVNFFNPAFCSKTTSATVSSLSQAAHLHGHKHGSGGLERESRERK